MAAKLSQRETDVLRVIEARSDVPHSTKGASGDDLVDGVARARRVQISPAGAHQTAASLVRKGLAWRAGTPKLQWYRITQTGRQALKGDQGGKWVAR